MKFIDYGLVCVSMIVLFFSVFLDPAAAKVMTDEDFSGNYYGARIYDSDPPFMTALYEITADGKGHVSFDIILGNLGPLTTEYDINPRGILTAESGIIKGAISPDGTYLAIGKFSDTHPPQLLFAIKQSSGLTNAVIAGNYHIYLLYEITGTEGEPLVNSNHGYFRTTDSGLLSGNFAGEDQGTTFTGDYTVDYDVASDGRLILTFTDGENAGRIGPLHGVVSGNGNAFVAVDTSEKGVRAYAVGIQELDFFPEDLAGEYFVTDFGYHDPDDDGITDEAVGSFMDFRAAASGNLSFEETLSNPESSPVKTEVTGTFTMNEEYEFLAVFDNYPDGMKTGGTIDLAPAGNVFALVHPAYFGIGIPQAVSGEPGGGNELTGDGNDENGDSGGSCFIRSLGY